MALNCNIFKEYFNLRNLNLNYFDDDHDTEYIFSCINSILDDWSIKDKVNFLKNY